MTRFALAIALLALVVALARAPAPPAARFGAVRLPDSGLYRGELRDGRMDGRGSIVWRDGTRYDGRFADGLMHGSGVWRSRSGERYEGDFDRGLFHGRGVLYYRDGSRYEGEFADGEPHGAGMYRDADGELYVGRFEHGALTGRGRHEDARGLRYEGGFRNWRYHGAGVYHFPGGDRYEGGFAGGLFHGAGVIHHAGAQGETARFEGYWEHGELVGERSAPAAAAARPQPPGPGEAEALLFAQPERLEKALAAVRPGTPGVVDVFFVGFAGDGAQDVFMHEVRFAAEVLARHFGAGERSLLLVNNPATRDELPLATATNLEYALARLARRMDEEDVLFLLLSSHGSEDHALTVQLADLPLADLPAARLGRMLADAGVPWQVVVVSACYSGGFIEHLAGERSLVITAARRDRPSFGCEDDAELTFFGRAFLADGLPAAGSFIGAFERARRSVRKRERAEGYEASEPQLAAGAPIRAHLAQVRAAPH